MNRSQRNAVVAFPYFWTRSEVSHDKRTGAHADVWETWQTKSGSGWSWRVTRKDPPARGEGITTTQKGARAACRRFVRKLSDKWIG